MSETASNPWKFIAIGCGVVALLACCCTAIGFFACGAALGGPYKATHAFFDAAKAGNTDAAYAGMSSSFRTAHPQPGFAAEVTTLLGAPTYTDVTASNVNAQNTTAIVSGTLTYPEGPRTFTVELVQEGAEYKVQAVTVGTQTLR